MLSLRDIPALSHFTAPQLEALEACTIRHPYPSGTQVVRESEPNREAFLIHDGKIQLSRDTPYGQFVLSAIGPGELFGEMSFVDRLPRSVDAIALEDSILWVLDPRAVDVATQNDRVFEVALYWALWRSLSVKLRQTNDALARFFVDDLPPPRPHIAPPVAATRLDIETRRTVFRQLELSNMEINFLASLSEARRLQPHQPLFYEGEPGGHAYVVAEGRIMISKFIPEAGEEALAFLGPGEVLGEMALIDELPRSADAKADDRGATVLSIRKEVFDKLLDIEKASSIRLLRILCKVMSSRVREANEKIIGWYILSGGSTVEGMQSEASSDLGGADLGQGDLDDDLQEDSLDDKFDRLENLEAPRSD